jgi:DNA-binding beta-propeller fold protein YncE
VGEATAGRRDNPPATISVGSDPLFGDANPFGIAVDPATDTIYTANLFNGEGPGTVSVIDGATCNAVMAFAGT